MGAFSYQQKTAQKTLCNGLATDRLVQRSWGEGRKSSPPWAAVPTLEVRETTEPFISTSAPGCGAGGKMLSLSEPHGGKMAMSPSPFLEKCG